jgi:membrane AbrB-like protein
MAPSTSTHAGTAARTLGTLALAGASGALCALVHLPLAWLLGAMVGTMAAAFLGWRLHVPLLLRQVMIALLGVLLGASFHPGLLDHVAGWAGALAVLAAYVVIATLVGFAWYRRLGGYDPATAYFASTPGGLTEMSLAGEAMGGDIRVLSLAHAVRVIVVVFVLPLTFRYAAGYQVAALPPGSVGLFDVPPGDAALLALAGLVGWPLAAWVRLPAGVLAGPLILSAALHVAGFTAARPPAELVAFAQVVVGAAIGSRFGGFGLAAARRIVLLSAGLSLVLVLVAAALGALAAPLAGVPPEAMILALAPGGVAEMSLVALVVGVDTAFVSTLHVLRIALIVGLAPQAFRLARRPRRP